MAEADPYRTQDVGPDTVVIASGGLSARLWRLGIGVGSMVAAVWGSQQIQLSPYVVAASVILMPFAVLAATRSIHAWFIPHLVVARPSGLRLAWSEKIMFLPWLRRRDIDLPWTDLKGIKTHTLTVNGISDSALHLTTNTGVLEIPEDGFDITAEVIQRRLLDHLDGKTSDPGQSDRAFATLCRERFDSPVQWDASPGQMIGTTILSVFMIGFFGWVAQEIGGGLAYVLGGLSVLVFGTLAVLSIHGWITERVLTLDRQGVSIGPRGTVRVRVPWEKVRGVRKVVTNGQTTALDLLRNEGPAVRIARTYGRSFKELAELLDPSQPANRLACSLIRDGMSPEEAMRRAELTRPVA